MSHLGSRMRDYVLVHNDKDHVRLVKKPWSGMSASIQRIAALATALRSSSPSYQSFKPRADSALFRSSMTQNPVLEISAKLSPRARKYVMTSKRSGTGGHAASARLPSLAQRGRCIAVSTRFHGRSSDSKAMTEQRRQLCSTFRSAARSRVFTQNLIADAADLRFARHVHSLANELVRADVHLIMFSQPVHFSSVIPLRGATTMLFCVSHRGGLTNGQQGAAEQSREAQTQEGEAEARTASVFFFCRNEQERRGKEARLTSGIAHVSAFTTLVTRNSSAARPSWPMPPTCHALVAGRNDGGRGAQHEGRIPVTGLVDFLLHLDLLGDVRPVSDHRHGAVRADADENVRLIVDRHWL
jgi:hypothetical protein